MDPRCDKPRDFVAICKNLAEGVHKSKRLQIKWFQKYEWLLEEHLKLKKEMDKLCEEKQSAIPTETFVREEGKTCLPAPVTTNAMIRRWMEKQGLRSRKCKNHVDLNRRADALAGYCEPR